MVVAVSPALTVLAGQLRDLGYDVVSYGSYKFPIDALVYAGESLTSIRVFEANAAGSHGVLMINAQGKTIKQIDSALKRRTYTPLF